MNLHADTQSQCHHSTMQVWLKAAGSLSLSPTPPPPLPPPPPHPHLHLSLFQKNIWIPELDDLGFNLHQFIVRLIYLNS